MPSKIKVRFAGVTLIIFALLCWIYPSYSVYSDYIELLSKEPVVRVSIITLWVPVGLIGAVASLIWMSPRALYHGKGIGKVYSPKAMQLANKLTLYFALAGIAFAAGWTYHSLDLLEKYGYVYSRDLTKITPTGIHLTYVKSST